MPRGYRRAFSKHAFTAYRLTALPRGFTVHVRLRCWRVSYWDQVHPITQCIHAPDSSSCSGTLCGRVVGFGWPIGRSGTWCPTTYNDRNINTTKMRNLFCLFVCPAEAAPPCYPEMLLIKAPKTFLNQLCECTLHFISDAHSSPTGLSGMVSILIPSRVCMYSCGSLHHEVCFTPAQVQNQTTRLAVSVVHGQTQTYRRHRTPKLSQTPSLSYVWWCVYALDTSSFSSDSLIPWTR